PTHKHIPATYYTQEAEPESIYPQTPAYAPYSKHLPTVYSTLVETYVPEPSTVIECYTDTTSIIQPTTYTSVQPTTVVHTEPTYLTMTECYTYTTVVPTTIHHSIPTYVTETDEMTVTYTTVSA
ncbi:hypothetical protein IWW54_006655, partial [Coemansia sp. RSA 2705]